MDYEMKRITEIRPYENNPRDNKKSVEKVTRSIREFGFLQPIVCDGDGVILAGHTRYRALTEMGWEECDVVIVSGLSEEQRKKYRLYDNKAGELAKWDSKLLGEELADVDFMGYDFGQPVVDILDDQEDGKKKICPCCGEVFYV